MNKKKILSSLALAGILTAGVLGANVNATTVKPVGVYKKLVEGKTVVPYVLEDKDTPITVNDIASEFPELELINGNVVTDSSAIVKTGDTFTAKGIEYTVVVYGDVNKDGKISTRDASLVQKYFVGKETGLDAIQLEAADVNNDGIVKTKDASAIQKYFVGNANNVIDELPPVEDNTAPVISGLPEGGKIFVKLNDADFTMPEVKAIDDYDGEVKVTTEGNVDITTEDDYTVTYTATDRVGNSSEATLTVTVDGTAPVIEGVKNGDEIYVKLNDNNFVLPEATATDAVDGEVEVTVEGNVDVTTEGDYVVTYTATDRAGNSSEAILTVTVDGTAPVISGLPEGGQIYINLNDDEFVLPEATATDAVDGEVEVTVEGNVDITTEDDYTVTYTATDRAGNSREETLTVTVDGNAPVISGLPEGGKIYVKLNDNEFVLPEATATDTVDGEVEVTVEGTVNKAVEGNNNIVYSAEDSMGNVTTETIIVVVDGTAPVIDWVRYSTLVPTRDGVTVTIIANEAIQAPNDEWTLAEDGMSMSKLYTENVDETLMVSDLAGNQAEAHIIISNIDTKVEAEIDYDIKTLTNSNVKATITSNEELQEVDGWELAPNKMSMSKEYDKNVTADVVVKDVLGNEATVNVNIENIDKTKPTAEVQFDVTTTTNGDVTVTILANEKLQSVVGTNTWELDSEDATRATAVFTESGSEDVEITDLAGNTATVTVAVTNIDKTAPVLTVEYDITALTNKNVTATIKADENVKAVEGWTLLEDGKTMTKVYSDSITENIEVYDLAGNKKTATVTITNIDRVPPVVGGFTEGKTSYQTVTPIFNEGTAILQKEGAASKAHTSGTPINDNGRYVLTVTDAAGNPTTINFTIDNVKPAFNNDTLKPVLLKNGDEFDTTLYAEDKIDEDDENIKDIEAELLEIKFKNEDGEEVVESINTTGAADGEYTLTYKAVDEAGNESDTVTRTVTVDATPASRVSLLFSATDAAKEVTVRVEFNEPMQVLDGWDVESEVAFTKKYTANVEETLEFKDIAGNITIVEFSIDNIDRVAPSAEVTYSTTDPTQEPVEVTITSEEELKAIDGWELSEDKLSMTKTYAANTVGVEEYTISDLAGNTATVEVEVTNIDNDDPVGTVSYSETENTREDIVVTISSESKEELKELDGWKLSEDKKSMTKTYTANTKAAEEYTISDLAGNTAKVEVAVTNIDREAPVVAELKEGISSYKPTLVLTFTDSTAPITVILQKDNDPEATHELESEETIEIESEGAYKLTVKDALGNEDLKIFNIDNSAINIGGITAGGRYKTITPEITEGNVVLNILDTDNSTVLSTDDYEIGTPITAEEGLEVNYQLIATDGAGNTAEVKFIIDTKAPETDIINNKTYTTSMTPTVNESGTVAEVTLVKDGVAVEDYTVGTVIEEDGNYELTLTDDLGNTATVKFVINQAGPVVTGVEPGGAYKIAKPEFTEETATLQKTGEDAIGFTSGKEIKEDGEYTLIVTGENGISTTITFTVDNVAPVVTGVEAKTYIAGETVIPATTATDVASVALVKDGVTVEEYTALAEITTGDGEYKLTVTDKAGNDAVVNFTIDTVVKGIEVKYSNNGNATWKDVLVEITAEEEMVKVDGWTLSKDKMTMTKTYTANTETAEEYTICDLAGNKATVNIVVSGIDKEKPTAETPEYSTTDATSGSVTVTIVASEAVQKVDGWDLADDQVTLTKVFEDNGTETVTLVDLAGNEIVTPVEVSVNNIYKTGPVISNIYIEKEHTIPVGGEIQLPEDVTAIDAKGVEVDVDVKIERKIGEVTTIIDETLLNASVAAVYTITYTAEDAAGNVTEEVRIINVV